MEQKSLHGETTVRIGVLALQGAFREHMQALAKLQNVQPVLVKQAQDLANIDGLVIPGGESTAMSKLLDYDSKLQQESATNNNNTATTTLPLKQLVQELMKFNKPCFGTCAGAILLSKKINNEASMGQCSVGAINASVDRNFFGRQVHSFEQNVDLNPKVFGDNSSFHGIFIRAPAIKSVGPNVEVLGEVQLRGSGTEDAAANKVIVAARDGNNIVTAFHPELANDTRFHELFVSIVRKHSKESQQ